MRKKLPDNFLRIHITNTLPRSHQKQQGFCYGIVPFRAAARKQIRPYGCVCHNPNDQHQGSRKGIIRVPDKVRKQFSVGDLRP